MNAPLLLRKLARSLRIASRSEISQREDDLKSSVDSHVERHVQAIEQAQIARDRLWKDIHYAEVIIVGGSKR
jgi:hypothetical protein